MPHPCVVCGRSRLNPNNREEEYMFFGFPVNDETRCCRWLEFCGREDLYKLSKKQLLQRMICSKHFQPQDFLNEYMDRLNLTAVPSIYDPKQSLYNITCILCERTRKDPPAEDYDGTTFHHFPGEEFRCLQWLDFVGVDSYYRLTRKEILYCYICSKHFDRSQFMSGFKGRLIENAIPNVHNPDNRKESVIELQNQTESITELQAEPKLFSPSGKGKKDPLPITVLESQACAACGRSRSDPRNKIERYKFHPFPAYEIGRCLRWCQFLGREDILKMSPNQIRKLVLCSKHFQTGQSFHKIGPCDAVPTIKDISESENIIEQNEDDQDLGEDSKDPSKAFKRERPLVSSKKPKIDNKPAPLAKKRGKSRRPTSINIPRPVPNYLDNQIIKKLPLPSATNWKIQLGDQLQPITINNISSNVANNQANIKKIIVPFTGDISTLGAPIPVHSLSSIPPGLLIKIDLPEQEQQRQEQQRLQQQSQQQLQQQRPQKRSRQQRSQQQRPQQRSQRLQQQKLSKVKKQNKTKNIINSSNKQIWENNNGQTSIILESEKQNIDKNLVEFLKVSSEPVEETLNSNEIEMQEEVIPSMLLNVDNEVQIKEEHYSEEKKKLMKKKISSKKEKRQKKISKTMKRTMFPINSEIKYFFKKMTPLMHRLPTQARAMMKLSIVNMVIDQL
ncbi:PREDICTED: uncharacterized protein LOC105148207 [Acromyrmex echinatior]|uniref:THAP-type domain-containing protein n=1 Tax=Acromyrmex echinatior TaxID=103372 RepID=F4WR84_ACREC|nr:PREDICTED: uncharacterized protein LOC105148207 [Acromyrmex echinatior]EGI63301.1 hypothetical protein G5I_08329 [Acromyrmex echinatior]